MLRVTVTLAITAVLTAGCFSGSNSEGLGIAHEEYSELTKITIKSVSGQGIKWIDITIDVDGKRYAFGEFPDFDARRYQVESKKDPSLPVETGDVINLPAVGLVQVKLMRQGDVLAEFEATIPDNRAPAAPLPLEPASRAQGVSRTPTFRWNPVSDPSGVSYTLAYSLDPQITIPVMTTKVERLSGTSYSVPTGKDLLAGQKYFWRIQAVDGAGNVGAWSSVGEFVVAGAPAE